MPLYASHICVALACLHVCLILLVVVYCLRVSCCLSMLPCILLPTLLSGGQPAEVSNECNEEFEIHTGYYTLACMMIRYTRELNLLVAAAISNKQANCTCERATTLNVYVCMQMGVQVISVLTQQRHSHQAAAKQHIPLHRYIVHND
jgi:hypothetical protein